MVFRDGRRQFALLPTASRKAFAVGNRVIFSKTSNPRGHSSSNAAQIRDQIPSTWIRDVLKFSPPVPSSFNSWNNFSQIHNSSTVLARLLVAQMAAGVQVKPQFSIRPHFHLNNSDICSTYCYILFGKQEYRDAGGSWWKALLSETKMTNQLQSRASHVHVVRLFPCLLFSSWVPLNSCKSEAEELE